MASAIEAFRLPTTAVLSSSSPEVVKYRNKPLEVSLDNKDGVSIIVNQLAKGEIVVMPYGATYGTAFISELRPLVAKLRKEKVEITEDGTILYEPVSVVASSHLTKDLVDRSRLHPQIRDHFDRLVDALTGIAFIRFPVDEEKANQLDSYSNYIVNPEKQIQIFPVKSDRVLGLLQKKHGINFYLVRSSNIASKDEESNYEGAKNYANDIEAAVFATLDKNPTTRENQRKRTRSQPIVQIPTYLENDNQRKNTYVFNRILPKEKKYEIPIIRIVRKGNTQSYTLSLLIKYVIPWIMIEESEDKSNRERSEYVSHNTPLNQIREDLLRASGIRV